MLNNKKKVIQSMKKSRATKVRLLIDYSDRLIVRNWLEGLTVAHYSSPLFDVISIFYFHGVDE
jgi:hypothetical protein